MNDYKQPDRIVWSSCNVNCGSRCPLRLHVRDGKVVRVEPDHTGEGEFGKHEIRACLRGRGLRKWVYSPERLLHPLKRVGKRGEGKFKQISWEEALDTLADKLGQVIEKYGNEAVTRIYGTGVLGGIVSGRGQIDRLMNILGGQLNYYNSYSTAQIEHGMTYTYGNHLCNNFLSDIVNSRLVVFFGNNPAETRMSGGGTIRDLVVCKQKSDARIIVIDPRHTDTSAGFADEWIPIRPGTDPALVSALAYVMITENMVDQPFLDRYCIGYDQSTMPSHIPAGNSYKDYVLGTGSDRTPKTPSWASAITGISADRIERLAREIASTKPAFISQGWGPQRHANGEQAARAICMLPILTGNIGIPGGNSGGREGAFGIPFPDMPVGTNPVETSIPCFLWTKAIEDPQHLTDLTHGLRGKERLETPIKFLWGYATNTLINQHSDIRETHRILSDESLCEMIVIIDNVMTSSAKYADIVLPGTSCFEESDLAYQGYAVEMGALILRQAAIEPLGECRPLFDICAGIARRMEVETAFTEGRTREQWVEYMYHECRKVQPDLPEGYEDAVATGVFKWKKGNQEEVVLRQFRNDPQQHPLPSPSGKIEIFSEKLWDISRTWILPEGDVITALPEYHATWGMPSDPKSREFPLQLVGHHYKQRTHSSYGNNPWLEAVAPQTLWINPLDAEKRGINHGDPVRVFNDIGETRVMAKVTPRIMPGVMSLPQGAWYTPDEKGVDLGGCINTLTSQRPSPLAKGNPQHTNLVEVEKLGEDGC